MKTRHSIRSNQDALPPAPAAKRRRTRRPPQGATTGTIVVEEPVVEAVVPPVVAEPVVEAANPLPPAVDDIIEEPGEEAANLLPPAVNGNIIGTLQARLENAASEARAAVDARAAAEEQMGIISTLQARLENDGRASMPRIPSIDDYSVTVNNANTPLGRGAFGIVLLATKDDEEYAIKCLKLSSSDEKSKHSAKIEVEILTLLRSNAHPSVHPSVVRLIDSFWTDNHAYLVLELYRGGNLFTFIHTSHPLKERLFLSWSVDLLNVLVFLQERHVGHLDIKPQNILLKERSNPGLWVNKEYDIVVSDFGGSHRFDEGEKRTIYCGTPIYMAPEVEELLLEDGKSGKGYTATADNFSAGMTMFKMVFGLEKPPFSEFSEDNIMAFAKYSRILASTGIIALIRGLLNRAETRTTAITAAEKCDALRIDAIAAAKKCEILLSASASNPDSSKSLSSHDNISEKEFLQEVALKRALRAEA